MDFFFQLFSTSIHKNDFRTLQNWHFFCAGFLKIGWLAFSPVVSVIVIFKMPRISSQFYLYIFFFTISRGVSFMLHFHENILYLRMLLRKRFSIWWCVSSQYYQILPLSLLDLVSATLWRCCATVFYMSWDPVRLLAKLTLILINLITMVIKIKTFCVKFLFFNDILYFILKSYSIFIMSFLKKINLFAPR